MPESIPESPPAGITRTYRYSIDLGGWRYVENVFHTQIDGGTFVFLDIKSKMLLAVNAGHRVLIVEVVIPQDT